VPEPDPETSFKANFSCHVLFKHLRGEVEQEMGGLEDLEVCPADECEYNIVQHKVRFHVLNIGILIRRIELVPVPKSEHGSG
jgi:hypothetical protein